MPSPSTSANALLDAARSLREAVDALSFADPVTHVYNPLDYAWEAHAQYLRRWGVQAPRKVLFLGMNPGPWGMAQVGVPFGEVALVRDWVGIEAAVGKPANEHPKRPIEGFACTRSEVSGRRLWGYFKERFGTAERFFAEHFVTNYCPLVFMEAGGRNRTPDKLPVAESEPLLAHCDDHLRRVVDILQPTWLVGVGAFARKQAERALDGVDVRFGTVLHPSPASPAANRGWAEAAEKQLCEQGIW